MALSTYAKQISADLQKSLPHRNANSLPKLTKVVLNYRVADSRESQEALAAAEA